MYEMEGALLWPRRPGSASYPASPALRAARQRLAPVRCTGFPAHSHVSGVAPRWCPLPTVKVFLHASASVAQGSAAVHFKFFPYPHDVHRKRPFIRTAHQLFTVLCTSHPQVTGRNPADPAISARGRHVVIIPIAPTARPLT